MKYFQPCGGLSEDEVFRYRQLALLHGNHRRGCLVASSREVREWSKDPILSRHLSSTSGAQPVTERQTDTRALHQEVMAECSSPTCESIVTRANQYHCSSCSKNIGTKLLTTCNRIYHLAEEVNNALYHEYSGSVERHYQDAFSSELRKQKFRYQSETSIALHYNDFPLNDVRADYFILPGGPNKFEENIVLEVKHAASKAHQLQLFNYLHSGPTNNNLLTKKLRYGILLVWPQQHKPTYSEDGRFAELSSVQPPTMELWVTSNPRKRTKFELLSRWGE